VADNASNLSNDSGSDNARFQTLLPNGLLLKTPIPEEWTRVVPEKWNTWLFTAQDTRLGEPLERHIRFVQVGDDDNARVDFQNRLRTLSIQPVLRVDSPLEAGTGEDGRMVWIVTRKPQQPLTQCPELRGAGFSPADAQRLLRETLKALAALHAAGLYHGSVAPENIDIRFGGNDRSRTAWLTGAEIGPVKQWSSGALALKGAHLYEPPGAKKDLSAADDVYAAGLVACQFLLGGDGTPEGFPPKLLAADIRPHVKPLLNAKHSAGRLNKVLIKLLDPDPARRPTARQALERLNPGVLQRFTLSIAAMAVVCLAAVFLAWLYQFGNRLGQDVANLANQFGTLESVAGGVSEHVRKLGEKVDANSGIMGRVQVRQERIADQVEEIAEQVGASVLPRADQLAEKCWARLYAAHRHQFKRSGLEAGEVFEEVMKGIANEVTEEVQRLVQRLTPTQLERFDQSAQKAMAKDMAGYLTKWTSVCKNRICGALVPLWMENDPIRESNRPMMATLVEAALQEPWDESKTRVCRDRMAMLEAAAKTWTRWAEDTSQTVEGVTVELAAHGDAERRILNAWLEQIKQFQPRLRLIRGTAPAEWGKDRQVRIWTQSGKWTDSGQHQWGDDIAHDYRHDQPEVRDVLFTWQPDEMVQIELRAVRWGRTMLIRQQFTGPLALWQAARDGRVLQHHPGPNEWAILSFRIVDQRDESRSVPGPPRDWKPTGGIVRDGAKALGLPGK